MSNVELIDRLFTLSNRCAIGDGQAMSELLAHYHHGAEVASAPDLGPVGEASAEETIRSYFEQVGRTCYVWYAYADQVQEHGDTVLALGGIRTVERETRDDRETPIGWVIEVRDGKVASVRAYSSHTDAMAAARLRPAPPAA